jgi:DNA-binding MarR family transcriptional regulator
MLKTAMHSDLNVLAGLMRRLVNRLIFLEKRSVFRRGRLRLHPSEVHLMQLINEQPDLNASEMAQNLGVTNGAVSQTLARLERKGAIKKARDRFLKNRVIVFFTPLGEEAIQRFEEQQASSRESFAKYLAGLSTKEREVIGDFLSHAEEFFKRLG